MARRTRAPLEHARGSGRDGEGGAGHEVMDSAVARGGDGEEPRVPSLVDRAAPDADGNHVGPSQYTNEGLPYGGLFARALPILHRMFLSLNRWVAVPIIRAGLAPAWGTPFGGYFVMIRTRGRKTGAIRDVPLGYGISDGCAYVMAGFGRRTQWLRNIEADPHVEVWLPGRTFAAIAEEVTDPAERARGLRSATIGCGLVGRAAFGLDPRTAPDESILRAAEGIPLVRLRPTGIAAGPDDPGGQGWILRQIAVAWISWRALRWLGGRGRRAGRR